MAPGQPPKSLASKRVKSGTQSSRKHQWKSFSQRIENLKIEPVRRARRYDYSQTDTSHFTTALNKWRDLNLSETFLDFTARVEPLSESLPLILLHQNRIVALLVEYIEKQDVLALEPLLDLVAQLAHDLGVKFEEHFEKTLNAVAGVAARHKDVEAIEWSFSCLAWLFKYLSRLLVPDLRPIFDWLAPLLGKQQQKHFVPTFAAEALSFLLRKAGQLYYKDKEPLQKIIRHILQDVNKFPADSVSGPRYYQGVMTLFAETLKSVQREAHSSAPCILKELISETISAMSVGWVGHTKKNTPAQMVLCGSIVNIIHWTDPGTFAPLLDVILTGTSIDENSLISRVQLSTQLILVVCGVRKAARITDWQPIALQVKASRDWIEFRSEYHVPQWLISDVLSSLALILHSCPLDVAMPLIRQLQNLTTTPWQEHFLPFCILLAKLNSENFKTLLLPKLQKFIVQSWEAYGDQLCIVIPRLANANVIGKDSIQWPPAWQSFICDSFGTLAYDTALEPQVVFRYNADLLLIESLSLQSEATQSLQRMLKDPIERALIAANVQRSDHQARFLLGKAFHFAVSQSSSTITPELWPKIVDCSSRATELHSFWTAVLAFLRMHHTRLGLKTPPSEFLQCICRCLASPSHHLRTTALDILTIIVSEGPPAECINTAVVIESSPLDLLNARNISMRIRTLGASYASASSNEWVAKAIPSYCFGILHLRLSQAWDDAVGAIKEMCSTKEGEETVAKLAFEWLEITSKDVDSENVTFPEDAPLAHASNNFECFNHLQLLQKIDEGNETLSDVHRQFELLFERHNSFSSLRNEFCRSQALKVLGGIAEVAEKRNRLLVPILLSWAGSDATDPFLPSSEGKDVSMDGSIVTENALDVEQQRWNRKDQKSLLTVFSQFNNPKVLYESEKVYSALLSLLTNADVDIQKLALKALLTWKDPHVTRYEEDLLKLLDEKTFRDQLSVFLSAEDTDSALKADDHAHVMPIILRILYGKVVLREGSASGKQGQKARRRAVFTMLARSIDGKSGNAEFEDFLSISLGKLDHITILDESGIVESEYDRLQQVTDPRKLYGLLNMLEDVLDTLRTSISPFLPRIIEPLCFCLLTASRGLPVLDSPNDEVSSDDPVASKTGLFRSIRQAGFRCLTLACANSEDFDWNRYATIIREELILPRLERLPIDTAQSISGLLRLLSTWSSKIQLASFLDYSTPDLSILGQTARCLIEPSAQPEVKLFVINEIMRTFLKTASPNDDDAPEIRQLRLDIANDILRPHVSTFLQCLAYLLRSSPKKDLLDASILCVADLAPFVVGVNDSVDMIMISTFLLRESSRKISPKTKHNLLLVLNRLIPNCSAQQDYEQQELYDVICSLFDYFRDRENRVLLAEVLERLTVNSELHEAAQLCEDLNSFDKTRLDEPDFQRRSKAYRQISDPAFGPTLTLEQWKPIVYNSLFFVNDVENLSIRLDASSSLRQFVTACEQSKSPDDFSEFIRLALFPSIQKGIKHSPELVRTEWLSVLAHIVSCFPHWYPVEDMHVLLAGNDDEASFFNNVLHIQRHRRLRALRRLATEATAGKLASGNISKIFLPLLEHFVFDPAEDESSHNLTNETIITVGSLVQWLDWPQCRALFSRYVDYMHSKPEFEKSVIKLVGAVAGGLRSACFAKYGLSSWDKRLTTTTTDASKMDIDISVSNLTNTMPNRGTMSHDLLAGGIPKLTQYIHNKDDTETNLRISLAVSLIKLLRILPDEEFSTRLPAVLLDIGQILRSRSQDVRDMTRKTLAEIATLIGPDYFRFLLKELRTALPRGYQLHVLSFTMHSILVTLTEKTVPGELDYCLPQIMDVIMDDIFGVVGQEKDAEEYISKMKEVKSQKSFDSMELVAKITSLDHLIHLIRPIQRLLNEKLDIRMVNKIDEILRRVEIGLAQNVAASKQGVLKFCYDVIIEATRSEEPNPNTPKEKDYKTKRYLISMKGAKHSRTRGATTTQIHKLARFGLGILRLIFKRQDHLQTPENLAGFIPIIGDSLLSGHEEVQLAAIKLLTGVIRVPLKQIDENGPVYVSTAYSTVRSAPSTNTELAQASLKLISAILRDRQALAVKDVKETQLSYLLNRLKPDLREPDRQGVAFNFIRAILGRKIVITEIYDIMDSEISNIMITNQTASIRDHARGVYVQFLLSYPQSKDRFQKQIARLVKNLNYEHPEGRRSVLETFNDILYKVNDGLLTDVMMSIFLGLIMTMVNDDSKDCKDMARVLIKKVFEKSNPSATKEFLSQIKTYMNNNQKTSIRGLGVQLFSLFVEVNESNTQEIAYFLKSLQKTMQSGIDDRNEGGWELIFRSLRALTQLCQTAPGQVFAPKTSQMWSTVGNCITYPHVWVKESAAQAFQQYLTDFARTNKDSGLESVPLVGSKGLELTDDMFFKLTKSSLKVLKTSEIREELAILSVKNILFLARAFAVNGLKWPYDSKRSNGVTADGSDGEAEPEDQDEDEDIDEATSDNDTATSGTATQKPSLAIHYLLHTLPSILRRPLPPGTATQPPSLATKTGTLTLLASLITTLPLPLLTPVLPQILRPLRVLTSPTTTHPHFPHQEAWTAAYKKYLENTQEAIDAIRKKLGDAEFAELSREVEANIRREREQRGVKRRMDQIKEPAIEEAKKRRRREREKVKKKERGVVMRRRWKE